MILLIQSLILAKLLNINWFSFIIRWITFVSVNILANVLDSKCFVNFICMMLLSRFENMEKKNDSIQASVSNLSQNSLASERNLSLLVVQLKCDSCSIKRTKKRVGDRTFS